MQKGILAGLLSHECRTVESKVEKKKIPRINNKEVNNIFAEHFFGNKIEARPLSFVASIRLM